MEVRVYSFYQFVNAQKIKVLLTKAVLNDLYSDTRLVIILQTMSIAIPSKISLPMPGGKPSTTWKYLRKLTHDFCLIP